jgi:GH18 family chitinase
MRCRYIKLGLKIAIYTNYTLFNINLIKKQNILYTFVDINKDCDDANTINLFYTR